MRVTREEVDETLRTLRAHFRRELASDFQEKEVFDASDADTIDIVAWLESLSLADDPVRVIWVSHREGCDVSLHNVFRFFDRLWYPSSDDMIVISKNGNYLLQFDHEEQFSLWQRKSSRDDRGSIA